MRREGREVRSSSPTVIFPFSIATCLNVPAFEPIYTTPFPIVKAVMLSFGLKA